MSNFLLRFSAFFLFISFGYGFVFAQDKTETRVEVVRPMIVTSGIGNGSGGGIYQPDEDDSVVTGATVRGRVVYEDSGRPVRYAMISLVSSKESSSRYSAKFVKTDENGEFVIKNVKAGTYVPYVKSNGILNQDSFNFSFRQPTDSVKPEEIFEKIEINGLGEIQIFVRAKRGGSISGKVYYADGEPAVGVKVEVLRKVGETYSNTSSIYGGELSVGNALTDDRGVYRLAGLPEGKYLVRIIEPVSHNQTAAQYSYSYNNDRSSLLKTYYPEGDSSKSAKEIEILPGQEQTGIDVTIPERRLFNISGKITFKQNGQPLANFTVSFFKIEERDELVGSYSSGNGQTTSNKAGDWSLNNLPKGKYRISIQKGYAYRRPDEKKEEDITYPQMSENIEITDKDLTDLNFEVPVESSISGTIVIEGGKDVPRGLVIFAIDREKGKSFNSGYDYNSNQRNNQQAVKQREFSIGRMTEGKYHLFFTDRNYYIKSATLGGKDLLNSDVELKEAENLKGVQIVLAGDMGTVKGNVAGYNANDQAIVVLVKANSNPDQIQGNSYSAPIAPTGNYEVKAAPGEYSIFVFSRKNAPKSEAEFKEWIQNMIRSGKKISVASNTEITVPLTMPN